MTSPPNGCLGLEGASIGGSGLAGATIEGLGLALLPSKQFVSKTDMVSTVIARLLEKG